MIGIQMLQNVKGSRNMSMGGETKDTTKEEDYIVKKKRCRVIALKSKGTMTEKENKSR